MNYQKFMENVVSHISASVSAEKKVVIQPVIKNNGVKYDGLVIIDPILNISPTIYLNPYYHRYLNGVSIEDIYEDILKTYETYMPKEDFDISQFVDFEKARKQIIYKLVNKEKNKELLEDIPYVEFQDLALIFLCATSDFTSGYGTILIRNQHLSMWNVDKDTIFELAQENTPKLLPYYFNNFMDIFDFPFKGDKEDAGDFKMYILTNKLKIHGATSIAYPGVLEHIADTLEENFIIIPSSIHEVLILPESQFNADYTLEDLQEMITEVNEIELTDDEMLSNHPYMYEIASKRLHYS